MTLGPNQESQFRFATDILRRLGEELNPNVDQGLIELVKNSYDADARTCTISLDNVESSGGVIRVVDDGDGMTSDEIKQGWLVIGSSVKATRQKTRLGRVPAGDKGLGRLAALRLGRSVNMRTRPRSSPTNEYAVDIDWSAFDSARLIDEVAIAIEENGLAEGVQGTEIVLRDLRTAIGRMDVKRLARSMVLLADPFGEDPSGFEPILIAQEYRDLEFLVRNRYFGDADYHLNAGVDDGGLASATVTDHRGGVLWTASHDQLTQARNGEPYACAPATFDLWLFTLSSDAFRMRSTTIQEVREWLAAFGGVHVYLNGLRVAPYGNPGDDWLEINLRRVRSPEERPGTNTSIGRVSVRDVAERLLQKTDRSGFIETPSFLELRAFAQDAMEFLARRRMEVAEQKRQADRAQAGKHSQRSRTNLERAIESTGGKQRASLEGAFQRYERSRDREVNALRREVQLYRTLSTAGITSATFAHESSGGPLKVIAQAVGAVERRAKAELPTRFEELFARPIGSIRRAVASLGFLTTMTLRLLDHDKRRTTRVDVHQVIRRVAETFTPFLAGRNVSLTLQLAEGEPYLRASEAAIESVVTNLLNNSLAAFERGGTRKRQVVIETRPTADGLELRVMDNGPGIVGIELSAVWIPGETTQTDGTGLGLTIVRDSIIDIGGRTNALASGRLGGAEFIISIPVLGWDENGS